MKRIENRWALAVVYLLLTCYAVFSVVPFFWTTIQSFKTPRQANSRVPLFIFEPTLDNYTDLWLKSIPDDPMLVAIALVAIFGLLVLLAINAKRFPLPPGFVYLAVLAIGFAVLWFIPEYVRTQTFYDYFLNTIIVTAGTICISISIGCMAGYGHQLDAAQLREEHPEGNGRIGHGRRGESLDGIHIGHHSHHVARHHLDGALHAPARL